MSKFGGPWLRSLKEPKRLGPKLNGVDCGGIELFLLEPLASSQQCDHLQCTWILESGWICCSDGATSSPPFFGSAPPIISPGWMANSQNWKNARRTHPEARANKTSGWC